LARPSEVNNEWQKSRQKLLKEIAPLAKIAVLIPVVRLAGRALRAVTIVKDVVIAVRVVGPEATDHEASGVMLPRSIWISSSATRCTLTTRPMPS
jgi:hypothetical protein